MLSISLFRAIFAFAVLRHSIAQMLNQAPQVKISSQPFQVINTQHMSQIVWTLLGKNAYMPIYCVSEAPVSQLRFVCVDCTQKNISGITTFLNSAEDQTLTAGFPTITLGLGSVGVEANPTWNGATIICQAAINGGTVDSPPSTMIIKYLRQPHVVDSSGSGPVQIQNQGLRFYVECVRGADGICQTTSRRKTLRCSVDSYPLANTYRWLKNGLPFGGSNPEITIGTEMIGQSIQCSANNGLYGEDNVPTSPSIFIEQYTAARVVSDNFFQIQNLPPFQPGNKVEMNQNVPLSCVVEGNPRPVVFWKLRRSNGQIIDAACPQGLNAQYREGFQVTSPVPQQPNTIRLGATCDLQISNYSFSGHYWCTACSVVSNGYPECTPPLDGPGERTVNIVVQGPPMQADIEPSIEQHGLDPNSAFLLVHYCADPAPKPPREMVFSIEGNDIQINQNWQNFHFEGFSQNNTVPNCYFARLRISPVADSDQRRVVLKLQNQYGAKQITVSLSDLLGGTSEISGLPNWLTVALVLLTFGILFSLIVIVCMRMNLFCFDQIKDNQTNYSSDKLKSSVHDGFTEPEGHRPVLYGNGNGINGHMANEPCKNTRPDCDSDNLARQSWCTRNPNWMREHCPLSCGFCSKPAEEVCEDLRVDCAELVRRRYCLNHGARWDFAKAYSRTT